MKNYYYILGLDLQATQDDIKKSYRKLVLKFHPDKNNGDKFFEERFKEVQEAYEVLSNSYKRKQYDLALVVFLNQNSFDNQKVREQQKQEEILRKEKEEFIRQQQEFNKQQYEFEQKQTEFNKTKSTDKTFSKKINYFSFDNLLEKRKILFFLFSTIVIVLSILLYNNNNSEKLNLSKTGNTLEKPENITNSIHKQDVNSNHLSLFPNLNRLKEDIDGGDCGGILLMNEKEYYQWLDSYRYGKKNGLSILNHKRKVSNTEIIKDFLLEYEDTTQSMSRYKQFFVSYQKNVIEELNLFLSQGEYSKIETFDNDYAGKIFFYTNGKIFFAFGDYCSM